MNLDTARKKCLTARIAYDKARNADLAACNKARDLRAKARTLEAQMHSLRAKARTLEARAGAVVEAAYIAKNEASICVVCRLDYCCSCEEKQ